MKTVFFSKRNIAIIVIVLVLSVLLGGWGCRAYFANHEIKNVLLISIDTCRADHLSCYGFNQKTTPNIDKIAKQGVLFENAYSPIPTTLPAHVSMFSGRVPPYHGAHKNGDALTKAPLEMLAEVYQKNGYSTAGFVSAFVLDSQFGTGRGFDHYDDNITADAGNLLVSQRRAEQTNEPLFDWLDTHSDNKFFLFLHYYDPHWEYDPPEPFKSAYADDPYAGEIAYVDHCIGQVVETLKERGVYDSTLIVITADHGEMRGDHGEDTHDYFIYQSAIKVPLIVKVPGGEKGKRIKDNVGLIDIAPTLCALTGNTLSANVDGSDISNYMLATAVSQEERPYYCESMRAIEYNCNPLLGVVSGDYKYIQTTRPELYHLADDPGETINLANDQPQRCRIMQDCIQQVIESGSVITDTPSVLDADTQSRLASLGYISVGDYELSFEFDNNKPDPKDFAIFHNYNITLGSDWQHENHVDLSLKCHYMIQMKPDFAAPYFYLGTMAFNDQRFAQVIEYFTKYMNLAPAEPMVLNRLGLSYGHLGQPDEALNYFEMAIEAFPDNMQAYYNKAKGCYLMGRMDEALSNIKKAQQLAPDNKDIQQRVLFLENEIKRSSAEN
jgi:arylsulfatase A-like enzyme